MANKRLFDVVVENQVLLPAHDIALEVGSFAADNHVFNVQVTDGTLNVRLITRAGFIEAGHQRAARDRAA